MSPPSDAPPSPTYRRILLKLSGEALMGERPYGIDPAVTAPSYCCSAATTRHRAPAVGQVEQRSQGGHQRHLPGVDRGEADAEGAVRGGEGVAALVLQGDRSDREVELARDHEHRDPDRDDAAEWLGIVTDDPDFRAPCPVLLVPPTLWEAGEDDPSGADRSPYP